MVSTYLNAASSSYHIGKLVPHMLLYRCSALDSAPRLTVVV